jgi:hypothetical protein
LRAARSDLLDDIRAIIEGPRAFAAEAESPSAIPKEALAAWVDESLARADELATALMNKTDRSPYGSGMWSVAYMMDGTFDRPNLADLLEILRRIEGHESGWPPWIVLDSTDTKPYVKDGLIECWLGKDQAHPDLADFWRASRDAKLYLLRSHQEDTGMGVEAKTILDLTLPVWHVGECLLHAGRFAAALGVPSTDVHMSCTWTGLGGRALRALVNPSRHVRRRVSVEDVVSSNVSVSASDIDAQLPELTRSLTEPLYQAFDFLTPPPEMYREELARMRGRGS